MVIGVRWCNQVYVHRLRRYIGAYMVQLEGKVDAIIFSAGMGENNALLRGMALEGLQVRSAWHASTSTDLGTLMYPCQVKTPFG